MTTSEISCISTVDRVECFPWSWWHRISGSCLNGHLLNSCQRDPPQSRNTENMLQNGESEGMSLQLPKERRHCQIQGRIQFLKCQRKPSKSLKRGRLCVELDHTHVGSKLYLLEYYNKMYESGQKVQTSTQILVSTMGSWERCPQ